MTRHTPGSHCRNPRLNRTCKGLSAIAARMEHACLRQECVELGLGVPGMCLGEAGFGVGKRCKWLIDKLLEPRPPTENPRVGSSILSLATINFLVFQQLAKGVCRVARGICFCPPNQCGSVGRPSNSSTETVKAATPVRIVGSRSGANRAL
jgi:hypothetical protein